jgi:hypothetical protein
MSPQRMLAAPVLAALVLAAAPARSPAQVLVPGNPPLTQEVVDLYQQMWEWYCDVHLTPEQRRQYVQAFVPPTGPGLTTLAMAQYRLGLYAETLATLARAAPLNQADPRDQPAELAFTAMAQHGLGNQPVATAALARLRELMQRSRFIPVSARRGFSEPEA